MEITTKNGTVEITGFGEINLALTLDCGQCFRWKCDGDGIWRSVAFGRAIGVKDIPGGLTLFDTTEEEVREIWLDYFDLGRTYDKYLKEIQKDPFVRDAVKKYGTIRILHQEPWETMCSFIISACNNIPRIKKIIERFCLIFGKPLPNGEYAFPTPELVSQLEPEDLSYIGAGFRAPYLVEAAKRVCADPDIFERLAAEGAAGAKHELMKFRGIGKKVAECIMLFSLGYDTSFPTDTHILAAMRDIYPNGLPECFSSFPGLAQQYVFQAQRELSAPKKIKHETEKQS